MKFAFCNEMFQSESLRGAFPIAQSLGYRGVEFAPFTLLPGEEPFDVRKVKPQQLAELRQRVAAAQLQTVGLHWLLAKTAGLYLTSPAADTRQATAAYLAALADCCAALGGTIMVLGSPPQRNLLPGVSYADAEQFAADTLRQAMPACAAQKVTIALEPLGPSEGDFLITAEQGIALAELVDSPYCRLHLDVKAMSSEQKPIADIIRDSRDWLVHFHANDPNLRGPGTGEVRFEPIFQALTDIDYQGWVSLEVFDYEPSAEAIARESIEYMRRCLPADAKKDV